MTVFSISMGTYYTGRLPIRLSHPQVMMLGDSGVGKSSLINQFMSSEYMNTYDASLGKCGKCRSAAAWLRLRARLLQLSRPWRPPRKLCMRSPPPGMWHDPGVATTGVWRLATTVALELRGTLAQLLPFPSVYCQCAQGAMFGQCRKWGVLCVCVCLNEKFIVQVFECTYVSTSIVLCTYVPTCCTYDVPTRSSFLTVLLFTYEICIVRPCVIVACES